MIDGSIAPPAVGPATLVWLAIACFPVLSVLTLLAVLLERCSSIRLRHFAEEAGGGLLALYERPAGFDAYRFLLTVLARAALVLLVALLTVILLGLGFEPVRAALWAALGTVVLSLVLELVNRRLVRHHGEEALARLTPLYRLARLALAPAIPLLAPLLDGRPADDGEDDDEDEASDDEIDAYIAMGQREGILEPGEVELVRGIFEFGDSQVRSVMTPRTDIVGAPIDTSLDELAGLFVESRHSRLPLYEGSLDQIAGVLLIRDLLAGLRVTPPPSAADLAKEAFFVPGTKPVNELMREMQERQLHIAIVVDEHGGTAGLVTMEDLLEELVGEIADEHDEAEPEPQPLGDGSWRVDGRIHLDELADLLGIEIADMPYETVAGLVLSELGDVPKSGAVVEAQGISMTVEEVSDRRIEVVRVQRVSDVASQKETADG
jgi:CBS domain containing-hemolysin-like protein